MSFQKIALKNLIASPMNARTIRPAEAIAEKAATLEAHGQIQPLAVRLVKKGKDKGKYEVYVGETRRLGFLALVEAGKITMDHEVNVEVTTVSDEEAREASLAENVMRTDMHLADQFDQFKLLADQKKTPEQIAIRFGTTPLHVEKILKLANVSPSLFDLFRKDQINLGQMQAFTVSPDHTAQEAAWFEVPAYLRTPRDIRERLTNAARRTDDRLVQFVGLDAYQAAGGTIERDLFDTAETGYLTDAMLLDKLAGEKLERLAAEIGAEGWSDVEIVHGYISRHSLNLTYGTAAPLSDDEQQEMETASARIEEIEQEFEGEEALPPEVQKEYDRLTARIDELADKPAIYSDEQKASARAIVNIDHDGDVQIFRGVLPDNAGRAATTGTISSANAPEKKVRPAHSSKLVARLTAHRTAALQIELANNPHVALAATVHALLKHKPGCLEITRHAPNLDQGEDIPKSRAVTAFTELDKTLRQDLPREAEALFPWLVAQDTDTLLRLLAVATASTVNVVDIGAPKFSQYFVSDERRLHGDQLAEALSLDMAKWWTPTAAGYFDHVSKPVLLAAVTEAAGAQVADNIAGLKKAAMSDRAEQILGGSGWLPSVLRAGTSTAEADQEVGEGESEEGEECADQNALTVNAVDIAAE